MWPGGVFGHEGNFGVPQILSLAQAVQRSGAVVTVFDLDAERALGTRLNEEIQRGHYDIVAISCYSSYDYLKVMALATWLRRYAEDAWFVVGGYHPSARPADFTGRRSPFDCVVVGEGEQALTDLVTARQDGTLPEQPLLMGSATHPSSTMPYPFELLERYRPVFDRIVGRVEIYLSRGCPYGCSFCMERSKRTVAWRALSVDEAMDQIERLEHFIDLRGRILRISDALFGMKRHYRRALLERLAQRPTRADKIWLLTRADLLEKQDFELMAKANVAPGMGLESGDPELLRSTGKLRGSVDAFYDKLFEIADWARSYDVPFGTNVIVGLPGETSQSLERTAGYLDRLFLGESPSVGFFGIDRFRLYPGSGIDQHLDSWKAQTGFLPHRPRWWLDADQDFLSEWNDPSRDLDFERCMQQSFERFAPRLATLLDRFAYRGPARDRYLATIQENLASWSAGARQRQQELARLWAPLEGIESDWSPDEVVEPFAQGLA